MKRTPQTKAQLIVARYSGATLRQAAAAAGVHVATACRWMAADPAFRKAMQKGERAAAARKYAARPPRRPRVPWRSECPACGARVVVRRAFGCFAFWRCRLWPICRWASWRPRYPRDCRGCGGPMYWSHSRKSAGCPRCRTRISSH